MNLINIFKMDINYTQLNKDFLLVYSPKFQHDLFDLIIYSLLISDKNKLTPLGKKHLRKLERKLISFAQLSKYITEKNENKVILATQKMKTDKKTIKFRKYGKIEIYVK